jgi:hypothetical protein
MRCREKWVRVALSWSLLVASKSAAISAPLYFKQIVQKAVLADASILASGSVSSSIQLTALGLMLGYATTRVSSGFILLVSDLLLAPVIVDVAGILPLQTFNAALQEAGRRSVCGAVVLSSCPA